MPAKAQLKTFASAKKSRVVTRRSARSSKWSTSDDECSCDAFIDRREHTPSYDSWKDEPDISGGYCLCAYEGVCFCPVCINNYEIQLRFWRIEKEARLREEEARLHEEEEACLREEEQQYWRYQQREANYRAYCAMVDEQRAVEVEQAERGARERERLVISLKEHTVRMEKFHREQHEAHRQEAFRLHGNIHMYVPLSVEDDLESESESESEPDKTRTDQTEWSAMWSTW